MYSFSLRAPSTGGGGDTVYLTPTYDLFVNDPKTWVEFITNDCQITFVEYEFQVEVFDEDNIGEFSQGETVTHVTT